MKKIKTAEEYTQWFFKNPEFTPVYRNPTDITKLVEKVQIEMLEYAVNKAANNSRTMDDPYSYTGNTGSEYPPDIIVDKQSILKTIDEIKKEL